MVLTEAGNKENKQQSEDSSFRDPVWGAAQLKKISIFEKMKDQERFSLYQKGKILSFQPGANVVIEGQQSRGLYIVLSGVLSVYKNDQNMRTMVRLTYLESGSSFGEMSLFDDAPRSATVVAEALCSVFFLDFQEFESFLKSHGDDLRCRFYQKCAEDMAVRFRQQNSDYILSQKLLWDHALRKKKDS